MNPTVLPDHFRRLHDASRQHTEVPWPQRQQRLQQLARMVREHRSAIQTAISADFGNRSGHETDLLEIFPTVAGIRHALKHGKKWMRPRKVATDWWFWPAKSRIVPQPLGVVGIVAPWNYPLFLTTGPLIGAFAAGNRAMVKTSEHAPAFSRWLADTVPQYFDDDELAVIEGGADIAAAFTALPFDHLLFTGSTAVGRKVMQAATANLTPVTLELGGKSPTLILEDADLDRAVARVMGGKLLNAGQTCIAPDYVLLPEAFQTAFIEKARAWVNTHYPDTADNPDYSHIINSRQHRRLQDYLQTAQENGATVWPLDSGQQRPNGTWLAPHLIIGAPDDTPLMQEEIFGPLLPLVPYRTLEEAIAYIRGRERPLALYVFGKSPAQIDAVLQRTVSGGVSVNETLLHVAQENLPFGGIGASGMGAYHGQTGFDTFSHLKPVFVQSRLNSMGLLAPPYGKVFEWMLKVLLR
ncbi:coniferyl aldehyde dehydrogenase [Uruburuella testudinis]|uniref:Aldehyde dehydrogenase n=1 Tax=Uruburuella testudinis TaxID=1282863 RepID=A0ABY4DST2_9NEIS|nr:coniferyl aldehyde dehydrogenase [Uruburuella testudinis]UOO82090.1 coniferyl aldehyde dehydrogenase [Uruburuella testudinis]